MHMYDNIYGIKVGSILKSHKIDQDCMNFCINPESSVIVKHFPQNIKISPNVPAGEVNGFLPSLLDRSNNLTSIRFEIHRR